MAVRKPLKLMSHHNGRRHNKLSETQQIDGDTTNCRAIKGSKHLFHFHSESVQ